MSATQKAVELLKNITKEVSTSLIQKATSKAGLTDSSSETFEMVIGIGEDEKELRDFIKKYKLYKPAEMVKFLVELHFAEIESISDGISSVRGDLLDKTISTLDSVRSLLQYAENNPEKRTRTYEDCISKLSDAKSELQNAISRYISEVETFDKRTGISFLIHSFGLKKIDNTVDLASHALKAYMQLSYLFNILGVYSGTNIENFLNDYSNFIQSLQDNKQISLMVAYDKNKDDTCWNSEKLIAERDSAKYQSDGLLIIKEEYEEEYEEEYDLENDIDFS